MGIFPRLNDRRRILAGGAVGLLLMLAGLPSALERSSAPALEREVVGPTARAVAASKADSAREVAAPAASRGGNGGDDPGEAGGSVTSGPSELSEGLAATNPPPDFEVVESALARTAAQPLALVSQLETVFEHVNWEDPAQLEAMTGILHALFKKEEAARSVIESGLEREALRKLILLPDDPRLAMRLADAYFAVVDDPALQRRFLLRVIRQHDDPGAAAYYDSLFARLTGRSPGPEELAEEEPEQDPT